MRARDVLDMLLLGAIWGGAFPLLRVASPAFGPVPLVAVRVAIAAVVLIALARERGAIRKDALGYLALGLINTAVPFSLFSYATLSITGGLASLLNATTPIFGALIAFLWLGERLTALRVVGIVLAFAGVAMLVSGAVGTHSEGALLGVAAGLAGAALYGVAASYSRRRFRDAQPATIAAGSVLGATIALWPFAIAYWPSTPPSPGHWLAAIVLGLVCTALAYVIYFRLLRRVGASRAVTVTFLIPAFGILWGTLFLGEPITTELLLGCIVVMAGTALATGLVRR